MRSKLNKKILTETPEEIKIFTRKYSALKVHLHSILQSKGISQNKLAARLGKNPSEISKWLNSSHNITLKTLCRLEAELGEELIKIETSNYIGANQARTLRYNDMPNTMSVVHNSEGWNSDSEYLKVG